MFSYCALQNSDLSPPLVSDMAHNRGEPDNTLLVPLFSFSFPLVNNLASQSRELDNDFLEPLFSDFPSVSHKYVSKTKIVCNNEIYRLCDTCDNVKLVRKYRENNLSEANIVHNSVATVTCPDANDVTVLPQNIHSYSHLLKFVSVRTARLATLRSLALPIGNPSICYEDIYDFSKWAKFTKERPQTQVFFQGRTFTYSKLPSFTHKKRVTKSKLKGKKKKAVTSCLPSLPILSTASILSKSNLNPSATPFNAHFLDSEGSTNKLNQLRVQNIGNIIIAHLNINSLRNKFDSLVQMITGNVDVLVIGETKLDATFPNKQFMIKGFKEPYRKDRNDKGGGVMVYVRDDIPSQEKEYKLPENVEGLIVEINLRKTKVLLVGTYHSTNKTYGTTDEIFLHEIGTIIDFYASYDKFLIVGDINMQEGNGHLDDFLDEFHAKNLVKEPTCYKNPDNPSCVDMFITNTASSFMKTKTVSTGLSDFHKMIVTVMRTTFPKIEPTKIKYRDFTKYDRFKFGNDLQNKMGNISNYGAFEKKFLETLDTHAPQKSKVIRANHKPYVSKKMRKAIMLRSQLQNKVYNYNTQEYRIAFKHQKNYCNRLYKRERTKYYANMNLNNITDNKKFWKTVKPLFGDKGVAKDKIVLVEGDKIITRL